MRRWWVGFLALGVTACSNVVYVTGGALKVASSSPSSAPASGGVPTGASLTLTSPATGTRLTDQVPISYTVAQVDLAQIFGWRLAYRRNASEGDTGLVILPVSLIWDTTSLPNGEYELVLQALDQAGNVLISSQTVTYTLHGGGVAGGGSVGGGGGGGGGGTAIGTSVTLNDGVAGPIFGGP